MKELIIRTLSAIVFVALMAGSLLVHPVFFAAVFLTITLFSLSEFYHISIGNLFKYQQGIALLTTVVFFMTVYLHRAYCIPNKFIWLAFICLVLIHASTIFTSVNERREFSRYPNIYLGLAYISLPFSLASCMVLNEGVFDGRLLLSLFIIIWMNDVGAYCLGTLFGQRPGAKKLAPSISPKKSWWGFWSGICSGVLASVVLKLVGMISFSWVHVVVIGILVSVASVCGDLCESVWKRYYGVKDSGNCIPGHGGMLDRFDSTIVAIPIAAVYLYCFGLL
ncbi:MAG: CDP-archaeol synthase [Bacteroidales bacterium]|nr:CDP-archaeol synthase [Candidatus Cryptobacteroides equifaecalis]